MGYFFTLLYLLTAYITPTVLFGPLSEYHVEIIVVLLAIVTSIPNLPSSGVIKSPEALALAGIFFSIVVSIVQSGWLGGVFDPIYGFMQPVFAFVLVAVNFKKRSHLQWVIALFVIGSGYFMLRGILDLQNDVVPSPYLYGDDAKLRRLRGLGFVNDPNDFSQVLVSLIPAVFLWRRKNIFLDFFLLGVPIAMMMTGMYLTHSRGAMLATMVVVLLAARRKVGVVPAAILSGGGLVALFAVGWSGGRDVSMDAGADRLDLWYDGMETIKAHPLFGIGLNGFIDRFGITAHNSIVICASELGIIGLFFWVLFVFSTVRRTVHGGRASVEEAPKEAEDAVSAHLRQRRSSLEQASLESGQRTVAVTCGPSKKRLGLQAAMADEEKEFEDTEGMARILLLSLAGLLTAGWFLSRALSMWLFMYCGMVYAVSRMNLPVKPVVDDRLSFLMRWSAAVTVGLLLVLYIILRARNLGH